MFAIGLSLRIAVALVRSTQGLTFTTPSLEGIDDFHSLYIPELTMLSHGLLPYRDFAVSYPPLFIYTLYPFFILGGPDLAAAPIIVADALTAVAVYYVSKSLWGDRIAFAAGLAYALSPFAIYYEGYVWFSSQPMALFAVLSLALAARGRPVLALSALAVSALFKQEALFMLPVLTGIVVVRNRGAIARALGAFSGILVVVSAPFLFLTPRGYLTLVSYGLLGRWPGSPAPESVAGMSCQNIQQFSTQTVMSCVSGATQYLQTVNNNLPPSAVLFNSLSYEVDVVSSIVILPLLLLLVPLLYSIRRSAASKPLACAYAGMVFLTVFSIIFHPVYRYYYVPIYALLLVTGSRRATLLIAAMAPVVSLLTPSGSFQELLPVLSIMAIGALADSDLRSGYPDPSWGHQSLVAPATHVSNGDPSWRPR